MTTRTDGERVRTKQGLQLHITSCRRVFARDPRLSAIRLFFRAKRSSVHRRPFVESRFDAMHAALINYDETSIGVSSMREGQPTETREREGT